jgi:hypothetical protein
MNEPILPTGTAKGSEITHHVCGFSLRLCCLGRHCDGHLEALVSAAR